MIMKDLTGRNITNCGLLKICISESVKGMYLLWTHVKVLKLDDRC